MRVRMWYFSGGKILMSTNRRILASQRSWQIIRGMGGGAAAFPAPASAFQIRSNTFPALQRPDPRPSAIYRHGA